MDRLRDGNSCRSVVSMSPQVNPARLNSPLNPFQKRLYAVSLIFTKTPCIEIFVKHAPVGCSSVPVVRDVG